MDKLNEFFKELKLRLSNPLIFSYLLSWIFINWQVSIALVFYKMKDLEKDNYASYIDLIKKNYNGWKYYLVPAAIAVFYTFGFPFIRSWIKQFQVWINNRTDARIMVISKTISIPMEKYLKQQKLFQANAEELKKVMEQESIAITENQGLRSERNQLKRQLDLFLEKSSINFLNGYWDIRHNLDGAEKTERVTLSNGTFYRRSNGNTIETIWLKIRNFGINPGSRELLMIIDQANLNPSLFSIMRQQDKDGLILKDLEEGAKIFEMNKYFLKNSNDEQSVEVS